MTANARKYSQYLKNIFEESYYGQKVSEFCEYLGEIGLLINKNDIFVVKRRLRLISNTSQGT